MTLIIIVITSYINNLAIGQRTQFYTDFKSSHKQNEVNFNLVYIFPIFTNHNSQIDYSFRYYIDAPNSGVIMDHWEDRKGDSVQGRYSLVEPEGNVRTVYYQVDKGSGFKAAIKVRMPGMLKIVFLLNVLKINKYQTWIGGTQYQSFGRINDPSLSSPTSSPKPPVKPFRHAEPIAFVIKQKWYLQRLISGYHHDNEDKSPIQGDIHEHLYTLFNILYCTKTNYKK